MSGNETQEVLAQDEVIRNRIPPSHAAQFYELLGGKGDANCGGTGMPDAQLARLTGTTHYSIFFSPALVTAVRHFLDPHLPETEAKK